LEIGRNRLAHGGQDGDDALFVALAGDGQPVAHRPVRAGQRQCLGNAQSRAIEQQQHRPVAQALPILARIDRDQIGQIGRLIGRDRAGMPRLIRGPRRRGGRV
jgi:hypothetical protein